VFLGIPEAALEKLRERYVAIYAAVFIDPVRNSRYCRLTRRRDGYNAAGGLLRTFAAFRNDRTELLSSGFYIYRSRLNSLRCKSCAGHALARISIVGQIS
jgi:hypothetical protein